MTRSVHDQLFAPWAGRPALFDYFTFATLLAALLLGGATRQGSVSDMALEAVTLPLFLAAAWRLWNKPKRGDLRASLVFALALVATPLFQLVPLPPAIWTKLPGRAWLTSAYQLVAQPIGWAPLTFTREGAWLAALSLIPPAATFLGVVSLGWPERRRLTLFFVFFSVASALLGLLQVAQGPSSPLRFFDADDQSPVGFFVNRNHLSALIYCGAAMAAAWMTRAFLASRSRSGRTSRTVTVSIAIFAGALFILCSIQLVALSRAGVLLLALGLIVFAFISLARRAANAGQTRNDDRVEPSNWRRRLPIFAVAIGGFIALALVFVGWPAIEALLDRFGGDPLSDERPVFAKVTFEAAKTLAPVGGGLGSFVQTYQMFEKPTDLFAVTFANHAHNDLLELAMETGAPGLVLLGFFLFWLVSRLRASWTDRSRFAHPDTPLIDAAGLIVVLLLIHELVDYPLRTSALACVFAFACALLIEPPMSSGERDALPASPPVPAGRTR